jgi:parallel beta-helix repeat protein
LRYGRERPRADLAKMPNPRLTSLLVLGATACVVAAVAVVRPAPVAPPINPAKPAKSSKSPPSSESVVEAIHYLPAKYATDGSVDYTSELQAAIQAASGMTLRLPPFPVRVSRRAGQSYCLVVRNGLSIVGGANSSIVDKTGGASVLYCENAAPLALSDFAVEGKGGVGQSLGHALVQVTGGSDIKIENVRVADSDADGIAVANATGVLVRGCTLERTSRSGIYLTSCTRCVVEGNMVSSNVGHLTDSGATCGSGMQLSGNVDLVCTGNVLAEGVGIGILCNANLGQRAPSGCVITANRIRGYANPMTPSISSGIRCENSNPETKTHTLVADNLIEACGAYGIYVEHHDDARITQNSVFASEMSGILVSSIDGALVDGNLILESDTSGFRSQAGIYLNHEASGVWVRYNRIGPSATGAPNFVSVRNNSSGADNVIATDSE